LCSLESSYTAVDGMSELRRRMLLELRRHREFLQRSKNKMIPPICFFLTFTSKLHVVLPPRVPFELQAMQAITQRMINEMGAKLYFWIASFSRKEFLRERTYLAVQGEDFEGNKLMFIQEYIVKGKKVVFKPIQHKKTLDKRFALNLTYPKKSQYIY